MHSGLIVVTAIVYLLALFAVAWWGDRRAGGRPMRSSKPGVYALSLAVYCTSWTFLGSVGVAAREGFSFLAIYLGPILVFLFAPRLIARIVRHAKAERITTVADFIGSRYGKNPAVAALATLIAIVGTVPYISLQLKAISTSVATLVFHYRPALDMPPVFGDLALFVAGVLGVFAILFGTRHADATEHQDGLVLAVAMESLVKLAAFLAIGIWTTFFLFDPMTLWSEAMASPAVLGAFGSGIGGAFIAGLGLSALVILLLPRQFHVAVVENRTVDEIRRARWLFPLYLVAINLFVVPIAAAGILRLGPAVDADLYVLSLPLISGSDGLALVAFTGGLSAATAMVIVASVALSIMISNDLVLPFILKRRSPTGESRRDETRLILKVRRSAILIVVFFGYCYYRFAGGGSGLASIGLLSFAAIAQLAPPLFLGLYWKRANARGAVAGMVAGILGWGYFLLWPAIAGTAPGDLSADTAFADPLLVGCLVSLSANVACLVLGSLSRSATPQERIQAAIFSDQDSGQNAGARRVRTDVTVAELKTTIGRYLGSERTERSFRNFSLSEQREIVDAAPADSATVRFSEQLLASAIGSASSRLVLSLLFQRHADSSTSALRLLDDASEALQYNRDLLRIALDQVDQGLAIFDGDFRLTFWNRQFRDLVGLSSDFGQIGTPLTVVFEELMKAGEIDQAEYAVSFDQLTQPPAQRQIGLKRSNRVLEFRVNGMPDGGLVATVSDMTERVRRAAALREMNESLEERVRLRTAELTTANGELAKARAAAESANLGKTRFLASAGHDILQPLNAARLYVSALEERQGKMPGADLAANIGSSLEAVEAIIGAVLDISRLDAGGMQPKFDSFPLGPLLRQIETDIRPLAAEKGISLRFVPTSVAVRSDRNLLRRLIQNLVSNAVKYTRQGKVVVGVRRRTNGRVDVEVADSGIGIPGDKLEAIYQEFVRLDEGTKTARGLGLGLSIVDRIARVLDLPVEVASKHGRGTRFRVGLPTVHIEAVAEARPGAAPARGSLALAGTHVLCIDNEAAIRDGMRVLLEGWGCTIAAFGSAEEALQAVGESGGTSPDLALVDYHLDGGTTGFDAVRALRARLGAEFPAILVTADRSPFVRDEALELGIHVLTKPLKPASLRAAMAARMRQQEAAE
ncbi:PAS domain-containing hybrid sensor histidine kinase/response regulator [Aurantimonas sp. VKM B-3413]|uniref:PAS domain-containing hybrid sensor histidine kinase/response regulator n=1 Tax=Aurantimonas sp. VKM B-3413 TaxID=2779401 RepID=UPI001E488AA2|nr:PAS domain-containing hybrid sensor histidine kinase/response regulator [Aurantimonas sp. VKM B-3413]MCB8839293.1 hybrid sensor histidine kinase/response regulator [Aurantimonas sp. VKM B-3413]